MAVARVSARDALQGEGHSGGGGALRECKTRGGFTSTKLSKCCITRETEFVLRLLFFRNLSADAFSFGQRAKNTIDFPCNLHTPQVEVDPRSLPPPPTHTQIFQSLWVEYWHSIFRVKGARVLWFCLRDVQGLDQQNEQVTFYFYFSPKNIKVQFWTPKRSVGNTMDHEYHHFSSEYYVHIIICTTSSSCNNRTTG